MAQSAATQPKTAARRNPSPATYTYSAYLTKMQEMSREFRHEIQAGRGITQLTEADINGGLAALGGVTDWVNGLLAARTSNLGGRPPAQQPSAGVSNLPAGGRRARTNKGAQAPGAAT